MPDITPEGSDKPLSESLPPIVERIARELRPQKIILFGSYAYGKPTPASDVDLLVVMETDERSQMKRGLKVMSLITPRTFGVDVIVRTPQEIEHALSHKGYFFLQQVVSEGRVMYAA